MGRGWRRVPKNHGLRVPQGCRRPHEENLENDTMGTDRGRGRISKEERGSSALKNFCSGADHPLRTAKAMPVAVGKEKGLRSEERGEKPTLGRKKEPFTPTGTLRIFV